MKTSLIATVLNEEKTIEVFIDSILSQTHFPDEVVIVDGGSDDNTVSLINHYKKRKLPFLLSVIVKKGNRSISRNEAIRKAQGDIMLITDVGCVLDKNWVKEITKPFMDKATDVVAGYYDARTRTIFEKCLVPYVLVMPDRINPKTFLPATRSMAVRKVVWKEIGEFDERYSHNEDYVFARKLREKRKKIVFAGKAIAYWIPRKSVLEAYTMFRRFAYGDMEASILRPKVVLIFLRYLLVLSLVMLALIYNIPLFLWIVGGVLILYIIWVIKKNYRYVNEWKALYYLPLIQFTSDIAVISGTSAGFLASSRLKKL